MSMTNHGFVGRLFVAALLSGAILVHGTNLADAAGRSSPTGLSPENVPPNVAFVVSDGAQIMDLALHIVDLYFGETVALNTARFMEYENSGWKHAESSRVRSNTGEHQQAHSGGKS